MHDPKTDFALKAVEDIPRGSPVALFFKGEVGLARDDTESSKNYLGLARWDISAGATIGIVADLIREGVLEGVLDDTLGASAGDQLFIGEGKLALKMSNTPGARLVLVGMALNEHDMLAYWQYIGQIAV